jgi:hypothetical protein
MEPSGIAVVMVVVTSKLKDKRSIIALPMELSALLAILAKPHFQIGHETILLATCLRTQASTSQKAWRNRLWLRINLRAVLVSDHLVQPFPLGLKLAPDLKL